jgi:acetyl-CoA C-acetyltransferase
MAAVYLSRPVKQFSGSRQPLAELALEGFEAILASGGPPPDHLLVVSAHPCELAGITGFDLASWLAGRARELGIPTRVEFYANPGLEESTAHLAASAAGAAVLHEGVRRVAHGEARSVAVLGVEQMRLADRDALTQALRGLIHPEERATGITMPALGALLTRRHEVDFPDLGRALTALTVGNRSRTTGNRRAHMRKALRLEDVTTDRNPLVSEPLRLFDVAPASSGYAGLVLSREPGPLPVQVMVAGIGRGLDRLGVAGRPLRHHSAATREAMDELLNGLGWTPAEFRRSVAHAEIHDAFPITEFLGLLDCGLAGRDEIVPDILGGAFEPGGRLPVNVMGGVMGGHPIAATGLGQVAELYHQALGRAETKLALDYPHYAFAFNAGGPLTYNCVTLLCAFRSEEGPPRDFQLSPRPHPVAADIDASVENGLVEGPAQVLGATRLEFPPPGFESPCRIALVRTAAGSHFVRCLDDAAFQDEQVELIRTNGHLSAVGRRERRAG